METITRIITVVGTIITVLGLTWGLTGAYDYFGGRRSRDTTRQDQGLESIISGGAMAIISGGLTTAIVSALNAISF